MINNRSIARNLYIIGTINALTGYYNRYYNCEDDKATNIVNFDSGLKVESEIIIRFDKDSFLYNNGQDYSGDYNNRILIPYMKEVNIVAINLRKGDTHLDQIYVKKVNPSPSFEDVLKPYSSYEEKQRFLLETLDKKGREELVLPKNKKYNFSKEEAKELAFKAMDMTRWLAVQVKEEIEGIELIK